MAAGGRVEVRFDGLQNMQTNLTAWEQQALNVPYRICQYFAPLVEGEAKLNAHWTDRTGNARRALRAFPKELERGAAALVLVHGMEYGVNLELGYMGRYAIILPTLKDFYPRVSQMMKDVVR